MSRKGENIFKRKDGRWEARIIHHYEEGKAKYKYIYANTYREAKEKKQQELALLKTEETKNAQSLTPFETVAELWLAGIRTTVKESTYTRYHRIVYKYLYPLLEGTPVSGMDAALLKELPQRLGQEGGLKKDRLSPKTVTDILSVLKAIFKYGKENGYPCPKADILKSPPRKAKKISIVSNEEQLRMEKLLFYSHDPTGLGIFFTIYTGVRIGELCGLRWGDIDFKEGTVTVSRTVERISDLSPDAVKKTKVIISEPKTESSVRVIPLPSFLKEYLYARREKKNCYLITGTEQFSEPHQFYIKYQKFLKENNIAPHSFHAIRHTFATRCVGLGFDTKTLSEILGHSNVTTTLNVYVHPTLEQKRRQMERLSPAVHNSQSN